MKSFEKDDFEKKVFRANLHSVKFLLTHTNGLLFAFGYRGNSKTNISLFLLIFQTNTAPLALAFNLKEFFFGRKTDTQPKLIYAIDINQFNPILYDYVERDRVFVHNNWLNFRSEIYDNQTFRSYKHLLNVIAKLKWLLLLFFVKDCQDFCIRIQQLCRVGRLCILSREREREVVFF